MSTRANVIIKDDTECLYFYRHSDGYPEVCGEDLKEFVKGYSTRLRNNPSQSAGHLILRGHEEYKKAGYLNASAGYSWKVGAYEPCSQLAPDIEYLYIIDLAKGTLETRSTKRGFWDSLSMKDTKLENVEHFEMKGMV